MPSDDRALARLTLKIWMISLPVCVLLGVLAAVILKSNAITPSLNMAVTICIVFLPLPIVALYGLLRGYFPSYDLQTVHRGAVATAINAIALVVYAGIAFTALMLF